MKRKRKQAKVNQLEVKRNDDAPDYITTDRTEPDDVSTDEDEEDDLPPLPPIQNRGSCP